MREQVRRLDPNLPVVDLRTIDEQIGLSLKTERLVASLSGVFGALATALAVIGLYGVMAYIVARRRREIGIRVALGALQGDVLWMVMRQVVVLSGAGLAVGGLLAFALSSLIRSQLYGLQPHDPFTYVSTAAGACDGGLAGGPSPLLASKPRGSHACSSSRLTVAKSHSLGATSDGTKQGPDGRLLGSNRQPMNLHASYSPSRTNSNQKGQN